MEELLVEIDAYIAIDYRAYIIYKINAIDMDYFNLVGDTTLLRLCEQSLTKLFSKRILIQIELNKRYLFIIVDFI